MLGHVLGVRCSSAGAAGAQPTSPRPTQKQQAGDLVKKAIAKSQAGDHALAIELYQQAYNIIPHAAAAVEHRLRVPGDRQQAGRGTEVLLQVPRG